MSCGGLEVIGAPTIAIRRQPLGPHEAKLSVHAFTGGGWGPGWIQLSRLPEFTRRPASLDWPDAQRTASTTAGGLQRRSRSDGGHWILHVTMGSEVREGQIGDRMLEVLNGIAFPPDPTAPIRFLPSPTWVTDRANDADVISAWTSNVDLAAREGTFPGFDGLPTDGVLITAMQVGEESPASDDPSFTLAGLPLDLPDDIETSWEGYVVGKSRSHMLVAVNGRALDISIYYGTTEPSAELRAEAALERLLVNRCGPGRSRSPFRLRFDSNTASSACRGTEDLDGGRSRRPSSPESSIGSGSCTAGSTGSWTSTEASGSPSTSLGGSRSTRSTKTEAR